MSLNRPLLFFAVALPLVGASLVSSVPAARAETVAEKPRLAITLDGGPEFVGALRTSLAATRRFELVDKPSLLGTLKAQRILLGPSLTVAQSLRARAIGGCDLVLDGHLKTTNGLVVTTRLFDLRTGEFSRDLSLIGDRGATKALAGQLATYVRRSMPLKCLVRSLAEDAAVLDLGEMDGVTVGATFKASRHPSNLAPVEVGTLRVTKVEPFAAYAEVEETAPGLSVAAGDTLVENTADLLLK